MKGAEETYCTSLNNFLLVLPPRTPCSMSVQPFSPIGLSDFFEVSWRSRGRRQTRHLCFSSNLPPVFDCSLLLSSIFVLLYCTSLFMSSHPPFIHSLLSLLISLVAYFSFIFFSLIVHSLPILHLCLHIPFFSLHSCPPLLSFASFML